MSVVARHSVGRIGINLAHCLPRDLLIVSHPLCPPPEGGGGREPTPSVPLPGEGEVGKMSLRKKKSQFGLHIQENEYICIVTSRLREPLNASLSGRVRDESEMTPTKLRLFEPLDGR